MLVKAPTGTPASWQADLPHTEFFLPQLQDKATVLTTERKKVSPVLEPAGVVSWGEASDTSGALGD